MTDKRKELEEWLDPKGDNFLGTGMGVHEMMAYYRVTQIQNSWALAEPNERKRRLSLVQSLCVELERIREQDRFSTLIGASQIESVITGDWRALEGAAEWWLFELEGEQIQERCVSLWGRFRALIQEAYDTRPGGKMSGSRH